VGVVGFGKKKTKKQNKKRFLRKGKVVEPFFLI
jgi:hypothetical protein